jgi:hypothetical protein
VSRVASEVKIVSFPRIFWRRHPGFEPGMEVLQTSYIA